ncbi:hypothetical protein B7990_11865 [Fibrobacter sp. UWB4]|nr:hypothetical protein B7990_11865 [Fibrobacter sp. UWB4]
MSVKKDVEAFYIYQEPFRNKTFFEKKAKEAGLDHIFLIPQKISFGKRLYVFLKRKIYRIIKQIRLKYEGVDYAYSSIVNVFSLDSSKNQYIQFINACIKKYNIDVVQMEMCSCLPFVLALPANVKKIFVHHEIKFVVDELKLQTLGVTPYRHAVAEMSKIQEIGLLNKCDAIITLSDIDKKKLEQEGVEVPIYSSVAVVNTENNIRNSYKSSNILSFVGPSTHSPNYIGIKWFLENCWNDLLEKDPSYTLRIIGDWSEDKRNEILQKYKNVEFLGFVPNLADALNNTIMIVPITVGSGIRMKILEASSLGIPFVSTTVGAEGLPFESGKDCFLSNTPEAFVESILKLKDKSLRENFAQKANTIVKEKYSMEALRKNRLEIYDKVLGLK